MRCELHVGHALRGFGKDSTSENFSGLLVKMRSIVDPVGRKLLDWRVTSSTVCISTIVSLIIILLRESACQLIFKYLCIVECTCLDCMSCASCSFCKNAMS